MADFTQDNGNQQVSIFPYQQLSSVYGNNLLKDVVLPGVNNVSLAVGPSVNNTDFDITIKAGSTFFFQRSASDPLDVSITRTIIGKITLGADAKVTLQKSSWWGPGATTSTIYLIADWVFDPAGASTSKYAVFSTLTDDEIVGAKAKDGTSQHILVAGALLNNNVFRTAWPSLTTNLSNYHVAYDYVPQKDFLQNSTRPNESFNVFFDPSGGGLFVGTGSANIGGAVVNRSSPFEGGLNYPLRGASNTKAGLISPPTGVRFYTSSAVNNTLVDVIASSTTASYYQVDFLRLKRQESNHNGEITWESFLTPAGSLDFSSWTLTKDQMKSYLDQYYYDLTDDGITLAIVIRPRDQIDGVLNGIVWPEHTLIVRDDFDWNVNSVPKNTRKKLPIYSSEDLGL